MTSFLNVFRRTPKHDIEVRQQFWPHHRRFLLLHEHGTASVDIYDNIQAFGGYAAIFNLYVDEKYRRNGIATVLMNNAEWIVMQHNIDYVFLEVNTEYPNHEWVLKFYRDRRYMDVKDTLFNNRILLRKWTNLQAYKPKPKNVKYTNK